jgi:predicted Zn-dependent protease
VDLEIVVSRGGRKVMERLWEEAMDHVSLTVVVVAVVAILIVRLVMSLVAPLAGPMSATMAQVEVME